jgi:hypothetical protein
MITTWGNGSLYYTVIQQEGEPGGGGEGDTLGEIWRGKGGKRIE